MLTNASCSHVLQRLRSRLHLPRRPRRQLDPRLRDSAPRVRLVYPPNLAPTSGRRWAGLTSRGFNSATGAVYEE